MKKACMFIGLLSFLMIVLFTSFEVSADQVYAEKKVTTEQTVSGLETSVEVKIVECVGTGSTRCTPSSSTTTIKNDSFTLLP